jgi:hypothetical protein
MTENQHNIDLLERVASVDRKLDELLSSQLVIQDNPAHKTSEILDAEDSANILPPPLDNNDRKIKYGSSVPDHNPPPSRVAISAREMDSIFQKVEKINHDAELLERVEKLERQNRKITIFGSMFMTLMILMLGASTFLIIQADLFNKGTFLTASPKVEPPKPSAGEVVAKGHEPQTSTHVAGVHGPLEAGPIASVGDPEPVAAPVAPKPAEVTAPIDLVGSITSNKYHYPGCKWAAKILPDKLIHFSSIEEARKRGYIPCPTCQPPTSER